MSPLDYVSHLVHMPRNQTEYAANAKPQDLATVLITEHVMMAQADVKSY